ncbi:MAG: MFS transporter [Peptostreptococcaceae bacterium]
MKNNNNYKYIIAISGFILLATVFSIVNSVSAILLAPVTTARNFTLSEYSLLFTISAITIAIFSPIVGALINKINIKIIMSIGSILVGIGYISYGFAVHIYTFYVIGVIVSIGMCCITTIPISTMISDWFEPNKKGSVMGIVFAGIGTGTFIWMQLVSNILEKYSYKYVYLVLGIVILIVSLPISIFIAKRPPSVYKLSNEYEASNNISKKTRFKSIKSINLPSSFIILVIGLFLMGISFAGIKQHVQSYLSTLGYSLKFNANIGSTIALVSLITNIIAGFIFDKYNTQRVLFSFGTICIFSIILLFLADIPSIAYLFAFFYGMTMCIASIWPALGISKISNKTNYSILFGFGNMFYTLGASIGPFLSGLIADTRFGYKGAWTIYLFVTIACYYMFIKSVKEH